MGTLAPLVLCAILGLAAACSSRYHCITKTRGRLEEHKFEFDEQRTNQRYYRAIMPENTCPEHHRIIGVNATICSKKKPPKSKTMDLEIAEDLQSVVIETHAGIAMFFTAYCTPNKS